MDRGSSYLFPFSSTVDRVHACALCKTPIGNLVGRVNYIGLVDLDMVQCAKCGLISTDPVPDVRTVAEGCDRLYRLQQTDADRKQVLRGFAKSYRRGALFARRFLSSVSNTSPFHLLEVGAGDGYFSAGIQAEIPSARVTLVDIVDDLMGYYQTHHAGFRSKAGELGPELTRELGGDRYDLIVFRDLLEHVRDPRAFLESVYECANDAGRIFFITPNGREDFWMIHQRFSKTGETSLLLLNHFHYFLPDTLRRLMAETGFDVEKGFKFGLKQHRAGLGVREFSHFDEQPFPTFLPSRKSLSEIWAHRPSEVYSSPLNSLGPLSRVYSMLADKEAGIESFDSARGHEFFVLGKKRPHSTENA